MEFLLSMSKLGRYSGLGRHRACMNLHDKAGTLASIYKAIEH